MIVFELQSCIFSSSTCAVCLERSQFQFELARFIYGQVFIMHNSFITYELFVDYVPHL